MPDLNTNPFAGCRVWVDRKSQSDPVSGFLDGLVIDPKLYNYKEMRRLLYDCQVATHAISTLFIVGIHPRTPSGVLKTLIEDLSSIKAGNNATSAQFRAEHRPVVEHWIFKLRAHRVLEE